MLIKRRELWFWGGWAITAIALASCSTQFVSNGQPPKSNSTSLPAVTLDQTKIVAGQTIYVPIYSHIYHYSSQNHAINLAATLSIRNTDSSHSIVLRVVDYYDTDGKLIQKYIENPVELKPMASTDFFIERDNISGGSGANFLVEWVAEAAVYDPIVEAVMINTDASQGISFVSSGRVLRQFKQENRAD